MGCHETSAVGDGTRLRGADVPERSVSDALRAYPEDLLSSLLNVRSASFEVTAGSGSATGAAGLLSGGAVDALPRGADRLTEAFTDLVSRERLNAPFVLAALWIALLLGRRTPSHQDMTRPSWPPTSSDSGGRSATPRWSVPR